MKTPLGTIILSALCAMAAIAEEKPLEEAVEKHREASGKVADRQDELSADVQQLALEQTNAKVRELLNEVEGIMDEATDGLAAADTGGKTLAAQMEVIEKIHAAAKEKQKQEGSGPSGDAMMDMMERMMGKAQEKGNPGKTKDGKASDTGSYGMNGLSDATNGASDGSTDGAKTEVRKVPKAGGTAGRALPEEFRKALDAYNRGAEKKVK